MKAGLVALGMSAAIVAPASAHDYSAVGAFNDSVEYLDPSTIKTDGDIKTFWTNLIYIRTNDLGIDWTSQYESINCADNRMITHNIIGYRMNGTVVGQTEGSASTQPRWIDIPPETEAAAMEDAVCYGKVLATESGASFLELVPIARHRLAQIAAEHPQLGRPIQQSPAPPTWRSVLRQVGRALEASGTPPAYSTETYSSEGDPGAGQPAFPYTDPAAGQTVYSPSECIGAVVMGVCHGTILPNQATHPVCHGEMLDGVCTGPMF